MKYTHLIWHLVFLLLLQGERGTLDYKESNHKKGRVRSVKQYQTSELSGEDRRS